MVTRNVVLTETQDHLVQALVASGRYQNVSEAMRAGLPVIATDVGGVSEVVVHGVTGLLVPPNDVNALQSAMQQLLDNPAERQRLGEAGRARYEAGFSVDVMAEKTISQYERLLGAHQGALASPWTLSPSFAN